MANHLRDIAAVFEDTGTFWENHAPQNIAHGERAKGDFVASSGLGPIALFIEYAIGIHVDAPANRLMWNAPAILRTIVEFGQHTG